MKTATEYYHDDEVVKKYIESNADGLTGQEREVVERYFSKTGARILDLGCGSGRTTAPLVDRGFDVIGVDSSTPMIDAAQSEYSDLAFQVGDATELGFKDESFDYVLFSFCGLSDIVPASARLSAIQEVHRVLKPEGLFAFSSHNSINQYLFNPTSLESVKYYLRFLERNARAGLLTSRYKLMEFPLGIDTVYTITPRAQQSQLRENGFEVVDIVQRPRSKARPVYIEPRPYYVAQKTRQDN